MGNGYYQITQIKPDIYRFSSPEFVFFELLTGTKKALLIDTGYGFGDVRSAVREVTEKPLTVVNTHGHLDHTCGDYWFEEVWLAEEDWDLMRRHNTPQFREGSIRMQEHAMDWSTGKEIYGLPADFDSISYIAGNPDLRVLPLEEGQVFDLGGKMIRTIATPGHTRGGMSFLYEEENWLYVGDSANPALWLFDEDAADRETLIQTYDKILMMHPDRIYGGHSPVYFTVDDIRQFKRIAMEADFDKGIPFRTPLVPEHADVRICIADGKTMADFEKTGFYSIVLDRSRGIPINAKKVKKRR